MARALDVLVKNSVDELLERLVADRSRKLRISIEYEKQGDFHLFKVKDNGIGIDAKILKEAGALVVAVDIHLPALKIINDPEICRLCTDAFEMGVRGSSLDLVIGSHIIEHFDDCERERFLREIARVLRPEAAVVIATPNPERGFHYQHSGVHKILYDRDHLYDSLVRYFDDVKVYGVYPRVTLRIIKGVLKRGKQFLKKTGLMSVRQIQSSIIKTSMATNPKPPSCLR